MKATTGDRAPGWWQGSRVVLRRELAAVFDSAIAPIYGAVFMVLSSSLFMNDFFLEGRLEMTGYFRTLPFLLILFLPAITMRGWSEEIAEGTFELLSTLPLRTGAVVLGKFLAVFAFYLLVLAGSAPIVVMLVWLGEPDGGRIAASYLGAVLLGAFFIALGLLVSALTREQIVAFVGSVFLCAVIVLTGEDRVAEVIDGLRPGWQLGTRLAETISVLPRYESFERGWVRLADLVFFALMVASSLALNRTALELRKV